MAHTVLFRGAISVYSFRHFQHTRAQRVISICHLSLIIFHLSLKSSGAERVRAIRPAAGGPGSACNAPRPRLPEDPESIDGGVSGFHTFIRPPVVSGRLIS